MSLGTFPVFNKNGRLRGSYVYMVFCQDEEAVYVKIGMSCDPLGRLSTLKTACPIEPSLFSYAEVRSKRVALDVEAELHIVMQKWRLNGEWFKLKNEDSKEFKELWKPVLAKYSGKDWKIKWSRIDAKAYFKKLKSKRDFHRHLFMKKGRAYRDFKTASCT